MTNRETVEAFKKTTLGALVMAKANEVVSALVVGGHIENSIEAKKAAYAEAFELIMMNYVAPNLTK